MSEPSTLCGGPRQGAPLRRRRPLLGRNPGRPLPRLGRGRRRLDHIRRRTPPPSHAAPAARSPPLCSSRLQAALHAAAPCTALHAARASRGVVGCAAAVGMGETCILCVCVCPYPFWLKSLAHGASAKVCRRATGDVGCLVDRRPIRRRTSPARGARSHERVASDHRALRRSSSEPNMSWTSAATMVCGPPLPARPPKCRGMGGCGATSTASSLVWPLVTAATSADWSVAQRRGARRA